MKKHYEAPEVVEYGSLKELVLSDEGGSVDDKSTPHTDDSLPDTILNDVL